jgi:hypothetical protein
MRQHLYNFMLDMLDICYSAGIVAVRFIRNSYHPIGSDILCAMLLLTIGYILVFGGGRAVRPIHYMDSAYDPWAHQLNDSSKKQHIFIADGLLCEEYSNYIGHHLAVYNTIIAPRRYIGLFRLEDVSNVNIYNMIIYDQQKYCGSANNQRGGYVCCSFPKEHVLYSHFGDIDTYELIMWIAVRMMGTVGQCQEVSPLSHYIRSGIDKEQRAGCFLEVKKID